MLTIFPFCWAAIFSCTNFWHSKYGTSKFTRIVRSKSSGFISTTYAVGQIPALLIKTSILPKSFFMTSKMKSTLESSEKSTQYPWIRSSWYFSRSSIIISCTSFSLRPVTTGIPPSCAISSAIAFPSPFVLPVTKTTLSFKP